MAKRSFTTRIDEEVLAVAQRLAEQERRSVTSVIEVSVLEYARARGAALSEGYSVIAISELTKEILDEVATVEAVAAGPGGDRSDPVWQTRKLLPFVGRNSPGTVLTVLGVRVASLDEDGLRPLIARIQELGGESGLVRR